MHEILATKDGFVKVGTLLLIVAGGFVREMDIEGSWRAGLATDGKRMTRISFVKRGVFNAPKSLLLKL